eukprot:1380843-Rhodomonas_salina.3
MQQQAVRRRESDSQAQSSTRRSPQLHTACRAPPADVALGRRLRNRAKGGTEERSEEVGEEQDSRRGGRVSARQVWAGG